MARRSFNDRRRDLESAEISTLPMIALFVILVTFLVASASSAAVSRVAVDVPTVGVSTGGEGQGGERYMLVVHILSEAFLVRDTETEGLRARIERSDPAALDALQETLAGIRAERPEHRNVILIPDAEISYDRVMDTADRARAAGLTHLSLASSSPGSVESSGRTAPDANSRGEE